DHDVEQSVPVEIGNSQGSARGVEHYGRSDGEDAVVHLRDDGESCGLRAGGDEVDVAVSVEIARGEQLGCAGDGHQLGHRRGGEGQVEEDFEVLRIAVGDGDVGDRIGVERHDDEAVGAAAGQVEHAGIQRAVSVTVPDGELARGSEGRDDVGLAVA